MVRILNLFPKFEQYTVYKNIFIAKNSYYTDIKRFVWTVFIMSYIRFVGRNGCRNEISHYELKIKTGRRNRL